MRASTKSWWRTFGWCFLLGAAGLGEAHRRDMRRIELTDARMDAYRAGQAHGARTEAARIAAEAEAQGDDSTTLGLRPWSTSEELETAVEALIRDLGRRPWPR